MHSSYWILANGLKIQWGHFPAYGKQLLLSFASATSYKVVNAFTSQSDGHCEYGEAVKAKSATRIDSDIGNYEQDWIAIGY